MQLSVKDAANLLNVAEKTVYRWIQNGSLPAYRIEGQYRINKALLFEWAMAKKVNISPHIFQEAGDQTPPPSLAEAIMAGGIFYRIHSPDKASALRAVVDVLKLPDNVDRAFLQQALLARESLQSTGIGDGIAVPHVRNPVVLEVDKPMICLCFLESPIDFQALDGKPVSILFTLITPTTRLHLHLLSRLSFALRHADLRALLHREASRDEIVSAVKKIEETIPPSAS